ncbi:hypothetical protein AB0J71_46470 [Nonomuraea sp. NPDC049637]|uniref:hypothetical protein n=1 Tax=Nonomuraea sp. NPDC049637 TaxID=3154356 RepID=UPI003435740E
MPTTPEPAPEPALTGGHSALPCTGRSSSSGCAHPADFDLPAWHAHCRALLAAWLRDEFAWAGVPLAEHITAVTAHLADGRDLLLWGQQAARASTAIPPEALPEALPADLAEAQHDPWHPLWCDLTSAAWRMTGRWLHPDTALEIDQMLFAGNAGNLLISCADRADPATRKPLDPRSSPYGKDQGVIAVPLFPFRALHHLHQGFSSEQALLLLAGTAVSEFAVHEALETFQRAPGVPYWDPPDSPHPLTVTITWAEPQTVTTGWPILPAEE